MRKLLCVVSLVALIQGVPLMVQAQQVGDPIDQVVGAGFMTKDVNGNFNEAGVLSRAELATILVKVFPLERRNTAQKPDVSVPDVPSNHWAYKSIQTVLKTGTMTGYRDGLFFPNQRVSRAEALAIFAQAYGVFQFPDGTVNEILSRYADANDIPSWARKSMATALYEGFVNTGAGDKINPLQPMTRGDMAYALSRYLDRQARPAVVPGSDTLIPTPTPGSTGPVTIPVPNPR